MDSNGSLSTNYQEGDGVHLNDQGNAMWIQELKNGIKTAQQDACSQSAIKRSLADAGVM